MSRERDLEAALARLAWVPDLTPERLEAVLRKAVPDLSVAEVDAATTRFLIIHQEEVRAQADAFRRETLNAFAAGDITEEVRDARLALVARLPGQ